MRVAPRAAARKILRATSASPPSRDALADFLIDSREFCPVRSPHSPAEKSNTSRLISPVPFDFSQDGVLVVNGTHKNDVITIVRPTELSIQVVESPGATSGAVTFAPDGPHITYKASADMLENIRGNYAHHVFVQVRRNYALLLDKDFSSIRINGGAGDDIIRVAKNVRIRTELIGGDGNDTLQAARANDTLRAGAGDDRLIATGGTIDQYSGGAGNDTIIGSLHLTEPGSISTGSGIERFEQIELV